MQRRNKVYIRYLLIAFITLSVHQNLTAQVYQPKMKSIYHKGWIDLNKNGIMDIYEDAAQPIEKRIDDLISKMTRGSLWHY